MTFKTLYLLSVLVFKVAFMEAETSRSETDLHLRPIEEALTQALGQAERILTETFLSDAEINIVYNGATIIPLENITLELHNIELVHLTDLKLQSSPFLITAVSPNLQLMNLELYANISFLNVTGVFTVAQDIINSTTREMIPFDDGSLDLTFHNLTISGIIGLNFNGNYLFVHTVDLLYRPEAVVFKFQYIDQQGEVTVAEERSNSVEGEIQEPIYKDLAKRLNLMVQEKFNILFSNVTIPELLDNSNETVISFKSKVNTQIGNLNDFVDTILNSTKENVSDLIHIPNLEKSFERKIGFIKFRGSFKAEDGWFKSLRSLHRTADVILRQVNDSMEVSSALGLSILEFGYNRYSAKVLNVGPSGKLTATVGHNSVSFRCRVGYIGNNCTVTLEELKVLDLRDIKMKLTGLGPANWLLSKVATSIVNRSKNNIIKNIEETVGQRIREMLLHFDCGNYFPRSAIYIAPFVGNL